MRKRQVYRMCKVGVSLPLSLTVFEYLWSMLPKLLVNHQLLFWYLILALSSNGTVKCRLIIKTKAGKVYNEI